MRNPTVATVMGFTAITVFGRAGDFVRPYLRCGGHVSLAVFDRPAASLLGFALTRAAASGVSVGRKLAWMVTFGGKIVGASCLVVLAVLFSLRHFAQPVRRRLFAAAGFLPGKWFRRIEKTLAALVEGVESTRSDGALLLTLAYSVLEWVLIAGCYWGLAQPFSGVINITLVDLLILMAFVSFEGVVQIPGVGSGTEVVAVLVLTELFGVRLELGTSFAALLCIIIFIVIVPVGFELALREGLGGQGLRQIGREAAG
jgi:hypothetical protein